MFCVSVRVLQSAEILSSDRPKDVWLIREEWLVLGKLPASCVVDIHRVDDFEEKFKYENIYGSSIEVKPDGKVPQSSKCTK